ncbi:proteasome complex subunit Rpn13 ubiquitin receptor [Trypanosoma brucei equiperdum]|nr:proteasome complex subunit Rpn13 ubiquitin receptor [Trypanosoma brucei equiperdum]
MASADSKAVLLSSQPGATAYSSTVVVKVQAGRMILQDGIVRPLLGSGFLFLLREGLLQDTVLTWVSSDGEEQCRVTLPPGRVKVSWVEKCRPSRVLLFDIDNGKQPLFFWMQSRSDELDEPVMHRIQHAIERNRQQAVAQHGRREIKMGTLQNILSDLWSEALAHDVNLVDILGSEKLLKALQEDPGFYTLRLKDYLPLGELDSGVPLDLKKLMNDRQVQWTAEILGTLLRHETTYSQLSASFLNGTMLWGANVTSFIVSIINIFLPQNEQQQMGE